jgi:glycosyltransferase involved in cell wall biosynthesis
MKLSICLATYNGEKFLDDQLKSFASQTLLPDELIVSDDGSNDRTMELVARFSETAPFEVISNSNKKGVCGNFLSALQEATGDLIFLSDQDDVWFNHKLETVANWADSEPETWLFMNDAEITDGDLIPSGRTKLEQMASAGIPYKYFVMGTCMAVRRKLLDIALPISPDCDSHDDWLTFFGETLGRRTVFSRPLQFYRIHGSNTSNFIVNTPTAIGRIDVLKHRIWKALNRRALQAADAKNHRRAASIVGATMRFKDAELDLAVLYKKANKILQALDDRHKTRGHFFPVRAVRIVSGIARGTYGRPIEWRWALRDLIG